MLDPWIDLLTAPFVGVIAGFGLGFFERDWGAGTVAVGVAIAAVIAVGGWISPTRPVGVAEARWDSLSRTNRRQVVRAVARGRAVSDRGAAAAAVDIADALAKASSMKRELAVRISIVVVLVALIVASTHRGAPPGWVIAGALSLLSVTVIGVAQASQRTRDRARRAAEANRALLAAPESVVARIRSVGA
jgi:hypothetical protein